MNEEQKCTTNDLCTIEKCDIFDFMAQHVGMTVIHPGGFKATQRLSHACHIGKNSKVVDIACGKGTSAIYLAQRYGCSVVGIDISDELVTQAKALAKRKRLESKVSFHVGDALDMPFPDDEFDVAIAQAMLVLVGNQQKAVQEGLRVTKPGGYLGWLELSWREEPTEEFIEQVSTVICAYCMRNAHTYDGWQNLFSESGVQDLTTFAEPMVFHGIAGMLADEGWANTLKITLRYFINARIRNRMKTMDLFFKTYTSHFGYGIYVGRKHLQ